MDRIIIKIGSGSFNDIVVSDDSVQTGHCRIILDEEGLFVENSDRKSETYVNGNLINYRSKLSLGDELKVGAVVVDWKDMMMSYLSDPDNYDASHDYHLENYVVEDSDGSSNDDASSQAPETKSKNRAAKGGGAAATVIFIIWIIIKIALRCGNNSHHYPTGGDGSSLMSTFTELSDCVKQMNGTMPDTLDEQGDFVMTSAELKEDSTKNLVVKIDVNDSQIPMKIMEILYLDNCFMVITEGYEWEKGYGSRVKKEKLGDFLARKKCGLSLMFVGKKSSDTIWGLYSVDDLLKRDSVFSDFMDDTTASY
jgi:hypothetical protein